MEGESARVKAEEDETTAEGLAAVCEDRHDEEDKHVSSIFMRSNDNSPESSITSSGDLPPPLPVREHLLHRASERSPPPSRHSPPADSSFRNLASLIPELNCPYSVGRYNFPSFAAYLRTSSADLSSIVPRPVVESWTTVHLGGVAQALSRPQVWALLLKPKGAPSPCALKILSGTVGAHGCKPSRRTRRSRRRSSPSRCWMGFCTSARRQCRLVERTVRSTGSTPRSQEVATTNGSGSRPAKGTALLCSIGSVFIP